MNMIQSLYFTFVTSCLEYGVVTLLYVISYTREYIPQVFIISIFQNLLPYFLARETQLLKCVGISTAIILSGRQQLDTLAVLILCQCYMFICHARRIILPPLLQFLSLERTYYLIRRSIICASQLGHQKFLVFTATISQHKVLCILVVETHGLQYCNLHKVTLAVVHFIIELQCL